MRKRFIAGAVCPHCQEKDTLAMWRENNVDVVECVKCGHQMREADKQARALDAPIDVTLQVVHAR